MDKLITWWQEHTPREQMILAAVGFALALFLFFMLAINPMLDWHDRERLALKRSAADVSEVRQLALKVKARQAAGANNQNKQSLAVLIDKSLRDNELVMRGFQPGANNDARLRLENAPYSALLQWLYDLEYQQSVSIEDLSLSPAKVSGRLMVSLRVSQ